jgi:prepilin peptidase CpaA
VQTAVVAAAIGVLVIIAYGDLRTRCIPNSLTVAIAVLGLARMALTDDPTAAARTFGASAVVFAAAFLSFWRGVLGGGDAKLVTAMALLVGSQELLQFLLVMVMCGGGLAVAILARDQLYRHRRHHHRHCLRQVKIRLAADSEQSTAGPAQSTVPYAVAITTAGVFTLILKPLL